jgi:nitronate monooxygenase
MNFSSGGNQEAKAWKDIWGCGQGIGAIQTRMSTADYVDQLEREYNGARDALAKRQAYAAPKTTVTAG